MLMQSRCKELFIVVKRKLHRRIDATHSAPTGEHINVDGQVWPRKVVQSMLMSGRMPANYAPTVAVSLGRIPESLKEAA